MLDETGSTNAEAALRAPELTDPTWIMAKRQTNGRGRRGRAWQDPVGNFAGTYLFFPQEPIATVARNSFVAALSLYEALTHLAPGGTYALKWPNDVLLNGRKIAGILLESAGNSERVDWLVIGIGVNLRHAPGHEAVEKGATPPSSVEAETGIIVAPEELLNILAINMAVKRKLMQDAGFGAIRSMWLRRAAKLGEIITARTMKGSHTGSFDDLDEEGNLILSTPGGRITVTAADVFF